MDKIIFYTVALAYYIIVITYSFFTLVYTFLGYIISYAKRFIQKQLYKQTATYNINRLREKYENRKRNSSAYR